MTLDARFHLLDRQIIDGEDRLVAKVDDLELIEREDGTLAVTALLIGPGALGARLGGRIGDAMTAIWHRLHHESDPVPGRIPVEEITRIDSAVHVAPTRLALGVEGLEAWVDAMVVSRLPLLRDGRDVPRWHACEPDPGPPGARRISQILGNEVQGRGGKSGNVGDVRVEFRRGADAMPVLGLIVNEGPVRFLFGPERRAEQGPAVVSRLVRRGRAAAGYLAWGDVGALDWDERHVRHGAERLGTFEP